MKIIELFIQFIKLFKTEIVNFISFASGVIYEKKIEKIKNIESEVSHLKTVAIAKKKHDASKKKIIDKWDRRRSDLFGIDHDVLRIKKGKLQ